ncbi:unnamed protein product [Boreogadus saida]
MPPSSPRRSCRPLSKPSGRRPAAVRQLRRCTPGTELAPKLGGSSSRLAAPADEQLRLGSSGVSLAPEKGIVLPELSCRASAEFPPPELLVRWSTKS